MRDRRGAGGLGRLVLALATVMLLGPPAAADQHPDVVIAVDPAGRLIAFTAAPQPFRVPPSRRLGIAGYAGEVPGFRSLDPSEQTATVRPLDAAAHVAFELIYADPGVTIIGDDGSVPMRRRDLYKLGQPPFDTHPVWIFPADARRPSTVTLRIRDRAAVHEDSAALMLSFDPDPSISSYLCPSRCEGDTSHPEPGSCPVCGLPLTLATAARYSAVTSADHPLRPGTPMHVKLGLRDPLGLPVGVLETVDQYPLHLFVVSGDLSWFAHGHPNRGSDGTFVLPLTFARSGVYTFFSEFAPPRVGLQVAPVDVVVGGSPEETAALEPDAALEKVVDGYGVGLRIDGPLVPLHDVTLTFSVTRNGAPVRDLEPFDGRLGHLVVVSRDRSHFLHGRPRGRDVAPGPDLTFGCVFPTPDLYRVWTQFQHGGKVVTVPFTLRVDRPAAKRERRPSVGDLESGLPVGSASD